MSIITLYDNGDFTGASRSLAASFPNLTAYNVKYDNKTSSIRVKGGTWIVYEHEEYTGKSMQLSPGEYRSEQIVNHVGDNTISSIKLMHKITLFQSKHFTNHQIPLLVSVPKLDVLNFDNRMSSLKVDSGTWRLYADFDYKGKNMQVTPRDYDTPEIRAGIGNDEVSSVKLETCETGDMAEIILYEHAQFVGKVLPLTQSASNLVDLNFNDMCSSIIVVSGKWTVFEHADYEGKSHQLTAGKYNMPQVKRLLGDEMISSVRLDEY